MYRNTKHNKHIKIVEMNHRRQRLVELQLQIEEVQDTIEAMQNEINEEAEADEVHSDDYHSEPTFPTTRRFRPSRRRRMLQNPPPTLIEQDNPPLVQNPPPTLIDLVAEFGWARSVEEFYRHGDGRQGAVNKFCHIAFFGIRNQVPPEFWSFLVGEFTHASLWKLVRVLIF